MGPPSHHVLEHCKDVLRVSEQWTYCAFMSTPAGQSKIGSPRLLVKSMHQFGMMALPVGSASAVSLHSVLAAAPTHASNAVRTNPSSRSYEAPVQSRMSSSVAAGTASEGQTRCTAACRYSGSVLVVGMNTQHTQHSWTAPSRGRPPRTSTEGRPQRSPARLCGRMRCRCSRVCRGGRTPCTPPSGTSHDLHASDPTSQQAGNASACTPLFAWPKALHTALQLRLRQARWNTGGGVSDIGCHFEGVLCLTTRQTGCASPYRWCDPRPQQRSM